MDVLVPTGGRTRRARAVLDRNLAKFPTSVPEWSTYPVREQLEERFGAPAFVDNDTNLMTLGAWRSTGRTADDVLFVKADSGIGAGIIANGTLVRGAGGAAGDLGHITIADHSSIRCKCGNYGCLKTLAAGWALIRDARVAAMTQTSDYLSQIIASRGDLAPVDIVTGALGSEPACVELIRRSGTLLGASISPAISILNPPPSTSAER